MTLLARGKYNIEKSQGFAAKQNLESLKIQGVKCVLTSCRGTAPCAPPSGRTCAGWRLCTWSCPSRTRCSAVAGRARTPPWTGSSSGAPCIFSCRQTLDWMLQEHIWMVGCSHLLHVVFVVTEIEVYVRVHAAELDRRSIVRPAEFQDY